MTLHWFSIYHLSDLAQNHVSSPKNRALRGKFLKIPQLTQIAKHESKKVLWRRAPEVLQQTAAPLQTLFTGWWDYFEGIVDDYFNL
jgi:hypothetical protein